MQIKSDSATLKKYKTTVVDDVLDLFSPLDAMSRLGGIPPFTFAHNSKTCNL